MSDKTFRKFVERWSLSKLPEHTSLQIWIDINSGMEHVHAKKFPYLDIKPENILLGEGDRAKVCHFRFSVPHFYAY